MKINFSDKPRCKTTAYSHFMDWCKEDLSRKYPHAHYDNNNLSRRCTLKWQLMPRTDKKRFQMMADNDIVKKRAIKNIYASSVSNCHANKLAPFHHVPSNSVTPGKHPKRYLSAYAWFKLEEGRKLRSVKPKYSASKISRELSKSWRKASIKTQNKYKQMAKKDKHRYDSEMKELKANGAMPSVNLNIDQHEEIALKSKLKDGNKSDISQIISSPVTKTVDVITGITPEETAKCQKGALPNSEYRSDYPSSVTRSGSTTSYDSADDSNDYDSDTSDASSDSEDESKSRKSHFS